MTVDQAPSSAGRREWVGLAVLALPTLLLALDVSVLYLALPHLSADLGASSTQQLWILDIYGFMIAGFLVTMGTLGDRIGRRRLLLIGATAFGLASVAAAYATSAELLIAARALLGVAGATLMPSTLALISNMFRDPKQRGVAIAVWISCFTGGAAVGPAVGGLLLVNFWWGSAFLMGVPVMVLLLILGPVLLPEYRDASAGRLDLTSVALSLAAILPVIYGLKELAKGGPETWPVVATAVGVVVGVVFVRRQLRLADPLVDVRLFGIRSFSAALGMMLLTSVTMAGTMLLFSQYLQLVQGLSPLRAGLWLVPATIALIIGSMLTPAVARKVRPGFVLGAGMLISAVGFGLLTQVHAGGTLAFALTGLIIAVAGNAPVAVLSTDLVVGSAPPEKAGSAASMSETSGEFGLALGVATLGSVGTAVYRGQVADTIPSGIPSQTADAVGETLASAVAAAGQLPATLATEVLESARVAFTSGLNVVSGIAAVATVALAALAVVTFGRAGTTGEAQPDHPDEARRVPAATSGADHAPQETLE